MSTYVHYANSVATPLDISPEAQADPSVVLCSWKQTECPGSQGHCTSHHPPALKYTTSDSVETWQPWSATCCSIAKAQAEKLA